MKKGGRYDTSGLVEAQFEPGSRGRVLRNLLGIKSSRKMDDAEASALKAAMEEFVTTYDEHHRFTAEDIREMHRRWLGGIYAWAGAYRQVNVSKDGFPFGVAGGVAAARFQADRRPSKGCLFCGDPSRHGPQLRAYGEALRRDYRPERCRDLTGAVRSPRLNARAIASAFAPVSTEVLLDTLVMSALRRLSVSRR